MRVLGKALEAAGEERAALNATAGRIARDCGRGGASAAARHFGWSAQYVSTLAAACRASEESTAA